MCVGICAAVYIKPLSAPDEGRKGCVYLCCFFSLIPSHTLLVLISLFSVNPMEGSGKRGKRGKDEKGERRGALREVRQACGWTDGWMDGRGNQKQKRERGVCAPILFAFRKGKIRFLSFSS